MGSLVLSADQQQEPHKAREYRQLMDAIQGRGRFGPEVYGNLMNTEERVLDTVDRVVNDARLQRVTRASFLNMSLLEIAGRTADVLRAVYLDLFAVRSVHDFVKAFTKKDRRIYLGLVLIVIASLLVLLEFM